MGALQANTALRKVGDRLTATLSRDWEIWGPNGGYLSAIALRAAGASAPEDHRPTSLTVQYLSVASFADVECVVEPVKQGRSAWLLNVALVQEGRRFLQAQVWTTNRTQGPHVLEAPFPDTPPPADLKTYAEHVRDHYGDEAPPPSKFWSNFDVKPLNWQPFDQPPERRPATLREWYSFLQYEPTDLFVDAGRAVVLLDTLIWPTHHRGLTARPDYIAPSLDFAVWFHEAAPDEPWLMVDAQADISGQGLIFGRGRVWTPDGRLVASGSSNLLVSPLKR